MTDYGPACRHYRAQQVIKPKGQPCGIDHPIVQRVIERAGTTNGLFMKLPCRPGPEREVSCPDYEPKTPQEREAAKQAMAEHMNQVRAAMPFLNRMRAKMIRLGKERARCKCPFCHEPAVMRLTCAIGYNNHIKAHCENCGKGIME